MGKKSKPPPAPDYTALAKQTAESNAAATKVQTEANRPNQTDVYGNTSTWTQDPTSGAWSQNQQLSQGNQQLLDQQNALRSQLMQQAGASVGQGIDMSKLQGYSNYDTSQLQNVDPSAVTGGDYGQLGQAGQLGQMSGNYGQMGQIGDTGQMGQLQGGYDQYGQLQENYGNRGQLQENYGQMGNLQGAGLFGMSAAGNSKDIQDATYKLLSPQREMARNAEIQRLKNQGLTEDSPAFQRAVQRLDQGDTQAQLQSLLAGQQEYGNQFARAQGQNQQNFGQNLSAAQLANSQQNQLFGQDMSRAGLANQNQEALYGQDMARQQFANQTRGQQTAEDLAQAQFGNQSQAQRYGQQLSSANLADQQNQQRYQQDLGQAQFGSQNQQQAWNQNLQGANFQDQQQNQKFAQALQQQQLAMALRGQQFGEQGAQNTQNAAMRQQQFGEAQYNQQQPLNNLQQMMQMQALNNPQFGSFMGAGTSGGTDYMGAGQAQNAADMARYNASAAQSGGLMSGLFSLGGSVMGGPIGGMIGKAFGG